MELSGYDMERGLEALMWRARRRWLMGVAGLMAVACTDSIVPPPPAVRLAFTTQPTDAPAGVTIDPVAVAIEDAAGNLVPSATDVVTVAIETNPGGGTLTGAVSVAAVHGIATFSNLRLDQAGAGYRLRATATGLTGATSGPFTIQPPELIAFWGGCSWANYDPCNIEVIGVDGSGRRLVVGNAMYPAWSRGDARLAYTNAQTFGPQSTNGKSRFKATRDGLSTRTPKPETLPPAALALPLRVRT